MTKLLRSMRALAATWRGRFILVFLTVQLALPLHYYLQRRDPHDERFAWRMFSPMRMARCKSRFELDHRPVPIGATFHEAWIEMVERGRFVVIEEMAQKLCRDHPGKRVEVTLECSYLDRPAATFGGFDLCTSPRLY